MPQKTYKLALMGAHAVGKTVFFGSYFHLTTQLGRGNYPVSVKTKHSVNIIAGIIRKLFQEHTVVEGTVERIDLSFDVPNLGMSIEFYDVPGGHTQDSDQWEDREILKDLQTANGVLFFVSAEDVLYHPDKLIEDTMVFQKAITHLRENPEGKRWRQDVPIYFLFTKCDLIPSDVTVEDLEARIAGLVDNAKKTGKRVVSWKVTSLGEWLSPSTPPDQYQPVNVLEPMESMFSEIKKSVGSWSRKVTLVVVLLTVLGYLSLMGGAWFFDWNRWNAAKSEIEKSMQLERFDDAQRAMQKFYDRFKIPGIILPSFLSPGPDAAALKRELHQRYEAQLYRRLQPYINVDVTAMPRGNPELFLTAAELVREYLAIPEFYQISPQHYEQVRGVETYYEVGEVVLVENDVLSGEEGEDELFQRLQKQLVLVAKVPAAWQDELTQKTDALLRVWVRQLPLSKASPEEVDGFISKVDLLSQHPFMPQELRQYLTKEKEELNRQKILRWQERVQGWIQETNRQDPEKAIRNLQEYQTQRGLPRELLPGIDQALGRHYKKLVDNALKQNADADGLGKLLVEYPGMPSEERERVETRIRSYISQKLQELERQISSAKKLGDLEKQIPSLQKAKETYPQGAPILSNLFQATALRLVDQDIRSYSDKINALVSGGDFGGAKHQAESAFALLISQVRAFGGELQHSSDLIRKVEIQRNEFLNKIEEEEYNSSKTLFGSMRHTKDEANIRRMVQKLKDFLARWPSSSKAAEVQGVQRFLEHIQGGVSARLIIVGGDFSAANSWDDTPDMFIEIRRGGSLLTKTDVVEDKVHPNFNFTYPITWNIGTELTFVGIEKDPMSPNDEVFKYTVRASGLFGYQRLSNTLTSEGNKLTIKLEHSIPECPWQ